MENVLNILSDNIKTLGRIEEEIGLVTVAIYQKKVEGLKDEKIKEVEEYFKSQSTFYGQNIDEFREKIILNTKAYKEQIDALIKAYDILFMNTFRKLQEALNSQKACIVNITNLIEKRKKSKESEIEGINRRILANFEKKLNFEIMINECSARLKWCIENAQKDINEIFNNNFYQIQVYKPSFFQKIIKSISNKFNGKKKFDEVIQKYERENLGKIKKENEVQVTYVFAVVKALLMQMKNVEEQISDKYNKTAKIGT